MPLRQVTPLQQLQAAQAACQIQAGLTGLVSAVGHNGNLHRDLLGKLLSDSAAGTETPQGQSCKQLLVTAGLQQAELRCTGFHTIGQIALMQQACCQQQGSTQIAQRMAELLLHVRILEEPVPLKTATLVGQADTALSVRLATDEKSQSFIRGLHETRRIKTNLEQLQRQSAEEVAAFSIELHSILEQCRAAPQSAAELARENRQLRLWMFLFVHALHELQQLRGVCVSQLWQQLEAPGPAFLRLLLGEVPAVQQRQNLQGLLQQLVGAGGNVQAVLAADWLKQVLSAHRPAEVVDATLAAVLPDGDRELDVYSVREGYDAVQQAVQVCGKADSANVAWQQQQQQQGEIDGDEQQQQQQQQQAGSDLDEEVEMSVPSSAASMDLSETDAPSDLRDSSELQSSPRLPLHPDAGLFISLIQESTQQVDPDVLLTLDADLSEVAGYVEEALLAVGIIPRRQCDYIGPQVSCAARGAGEPWGLVVWTDIPDHLTSQHCTESSRQLSGRGQLEAVVQRLREECLLMGKVEYQCLGKAAPSVTADVLVGQPLRPVTVQLKLGGLSAAMDEVAETRFMMRLFERAPRLFILHKLLLLIVETNKAAYQLVGFFVHPHMLVYMWVRYIQHQRGASWLGHDLDNVLADIVWDSSPLKGPEIQRYHELISQLLGVVAGEVTSDDGRSAFTDLFGLCKHYQQPAAAGLSHQVNVRDFVTAAEQAAAAAAGPSEAGTAANSANSSQQQQQQVWPSLQTDKWSLIHLQRMFAQIAAQMSGADPSNLLQQVLELAAQTQDCHDRSQSPAAAMMTADVMRQLASCVINMLLVPSSDLVPLQQQQQQQQPPSAHPADSPDAPIKCIAEHALQTGRRAEAESAAGHIESGRSLFLAALRRMGRAAGLAEAEHCRKSLQLCAGLTNQLAELGCKVLIAADKKVKAESEWLRSHEPEYTRNINFRQHQLSQGGGDGARRKLQSAQAQLDRAAGRVSKANNSQEVIDTSHRSSVHMYVLLQRAVRRAAADAAAGAAAARGVDVLAAGCVPGVAGMQLIVECLQQSLQNIGL